LLYLSTSCFRSDSVVDSISQLSSITNNIELSGGSNYEDNLLDKLEGIQEEKELEFLMHSYFPPPQEHFVLNFAENSERVRSFTSKSVNFCSNLNIPYYSIHTGFKRDFYLKNEILSNGTGDFAIDGIKQNIEWFYKNFDLKLAVENLFPNNQKENCFADHVSSIDEVLKLDNRLYLLLDLGHLKISSRYYGFNYFDAVDYLFRQYSDRILEVHLSENDGINDQHNLIYSDSSQYFIIKKYVDLVKKNGINLVIETRDETLNNLELCYKLFKQLLGEDNEL